MTLWLRARASRDLVEAEDWYNDQRAGLGFEFTTAALALLDRIDATPAQFPRSHANVRRALLRRFPFAIYFIIEGSDRVVIAVLHQATDPDRLLGR